MGGCVMGRFLAILAVLVFTAGNIFGASDKTLATVNNETIFSS
jgi:hypothetical protein